MTIETRETLHSIFPDDGEALHALKLGNGHFSTLSERHETLSKEIFQIETESEPASDERLELLKKERLAALDEIAGLIAAQRA